MKKNRVLVFLCFVVLFSTNVFAAQADTVRAMDVAANIPAINANGSDLCWDQVEWQPIDENWIEWGVPLDSTDFWGRYKAIWSSETNLMYILAEFVDDTLVDGYVYSPDRTIAGNYPDYDIFEIFIDQDKSGGLHVFDGITESDKNNWGVNAENAYAYHLAPLQNPDSVLVTEVAACDLAGSTWWSADGEGVAYVINFVDHIPEFSLTFTEDRYVWEFSMQVHDDTFTEADPEASRVTIQAGDVMGFSVAYCDNDGQFEDPLTRDNFIGSVWVPQAEYNDHWMQADGFGTLMLVDETTVVEANQININSNFEIYPNPGNGMFTIKTVSVQSAPVNVRVYNILGQTVYQERIVSANQINAKQINLNHLPNGIYIMSMEMDNQIFNKRIRILKY